MTHRQRAAVAGRQAQHRRPDDPVRLAANAAQETAALVTSLRDFIRDVPELDPIPASVAVATQGPLRSLGNRDQAGSGAGAGRAVAGTVRWAAEVGAAAVSAAVAQPTGRIARKTTGRVRIEASMPASLKRRRKTAPLRACAVRRRRSLAARSAARPPPLP